MARRFVTLGLVVVILYCTVRITEGQNDRKDLHRCPSGLDGEVRTFNEKCYRFVARDVHWNQAQTDCQLQRGNLVHIKDQPTQNLIYHTVTNTLKWRVNGMWIGAHDQRKTNRWEWVRGSSVAPGERVRYNNWAPGQPSCGILCIEHCVLMRFDDDGRWHDVECHARFLFSTERYRYTCMYDMRPATTTTTTTTPAHTTTTTPAPTTTTATTNAATVTSTTAPPTEPPNKPSQDRKDLHRCPSGLDGEVRTFNGKCFRFVARDVVQWNQAQTDCQLQRGNLVHIKDQPTQNFIYHTVNNTLKWTVNGMWIGAHDQRETNRWEWVRGSSTVPGERVRYNNWAPGQPSCGILCVEHCGQMRFDDYGRWHGVQCHARFLFRTARYRYTCMYDMRPATTTTTTTTSAATTTSTPAPTITTATTTTVTSTIITAATTEPPTKPKQGKPSGIHRQLL